MKYFIITFIFTITGNLFAVKLSIQCNPIENMYADPIYYADITNTENCLCIERLSDTMSVYEINDIDNSIKFVIDEEESLSIKFYKTHATVYMTRFIICTVSILDKELYDVHLVMINN